MPPWEPTVIKRVMEVLTTSTCPARVQTDDGPAYAKVPGNPSGPHALACELVGTRLAAWLGLPTFDLALVHYPGRPVIEFANNMVAAPGTAILTRFVEGTAWGTSPQGIRLVSNPDVIAGLVVFDTWTRNKDRYYPHRDSVRDNRGNVFLTSEGAPPRRFRLLAIDHTECIREHSGELNRNLTYIDRVKDANVHGLFPEFVPYVTRTSVGPFIDRLGEFGRSDAEAILDAIPSDWSVNGGTRRAVQEFLCARSRFLCGNLKAMLASVCAWQPDLFN